MSGQGYKDLEVWQKAMLLVTDIYAITRKFPKEELYGLVSQIRRAAISVPSNIAEGRSKRSTRDFIRFLNIAYGSAAELETQMMIATNLGYLSAKEANPILEEISRISRMLNGLLSSLEKKLPSSRMPNPVPRIPGEEYA